MCKRNNVCSSNQAILVVSFGTSYEETRKKTIERIEEDIKSHYPEYRIYRAWTSDMIRRKVLNRDGLHIFDVKEAMQAMIQDGVRRVIVQPTHVLNGIENDRMLADLMLFEAEFERLEIGTPLMTTQQDSDRIIPILAKELHPDSDEVVIFMGHGTEHYSNSIYAALDYQFKDMGYRNIFMGTVEAYPSFDSLLKKVDELHPKKAILAPFMIVAGEHANNDLSGNEKDSWKSRFEDAGYEVECVLKGLGEYPDVRKMFLDHIDQTIQRMNQTITGTQ